MKTLKLELEIIPEPLWGRNLRHSLKAIEWRVLRLDALAKANNACEVCGAKIGDEGVTKLYCHEQWKYDDNLCVQKLVGLIITCFICNLVNHMGFANAQWAEGLLKENPEDVENHFLKVNGCTREVYKSHIKKASDKWFERNYKEWTQDTSFLDKIYPRELLDTRVEHLRAMERGAEMVKKQRENVFKQVINLQEQGMSYVLVEKG